MQGQMYMIDILTGNMFSVLWHLWDDHEDQDDNNDMLMMMM